MKKVFLFAAAALMSLAASATDIFTGSQYVTWGQGLQIQASQFASAQVGNELVVTFTGASDGIEFKVMNANFDHLAGSRNAAWISGDGNITVVLTNVDLLKTYGLEIIGANLTVTKVELNEGSELPKGTIWKGLFWMDDWSTLELYADAYKHLDLTKLKAIYFYSEANRTDYVLNFKRGWDSDQHIASQGDMEMTNDYAKLVVTDAVRAHLNAADIIMIQCNKETGAAFNFTSVVFEMEANETALDNISAETSTKSIINGQLIIERNGLRYNALGQKL